MRLGPIVLSGFLVATVLGATVAVGGSPARADEDRLVAMPPPAVEAAPRPAAVAPQRPAARQLHPAACASLCRVFEFLGALERPAPPREPVPTS